VKLPGFAAEGALQATRGSYRSIMYTGSPVKVGALAAQLVGSRFGGRFGGGVFGTIGDYWVCRDRCATAHAACLDTCEGTWENPKASRNCLICDDQYRACLAGCSSDIA